jgi:lysophospholipase L1-like esterase
MAETARVTMPKFVHLRWQTQALIAGGVMCCLWLGIPSGAAAAFLQSDTQGLVSVEAEHFHGKTALGGHDWSAQSTPLGFSGTGAMVALPNDGTNHKTNYAATSPRMDFNVKFVATGTHYVWVRGVGSTCSDDSLHVGLDGQEIRTSADIELPQGGGYVGILTAEPWCQLRQAFRQLVRWWDSQPTQPTTQATQSYSWNSGNFSVDVATTGVHTINVWMWEDGTLVDKIVLATDPAFVPTGLGPTESATATECVVFPSVTITSPLAGHLQSSTLLTIETLTCLDAIVHKGWGVKFELDDGVAGGGKEFFDYSAPFAATFPDVALAEHKVAAFVVNPSGTVQAVDTESPVGVGGYYVAIGDSITKAENDDQLFDDVSADGRNRGGGYEPILNNLLTAALGYPHTVVNAGIGGITSAGGLAALPNVLATHPQARRYLVAYGMNDARPFRPVPSGLGLNPGDPGYAGTYKDNMQQIINLIHGAGKEAMLAKVGIALGDGARTTPPYPDPNQGARSLLIQQFNLVLDELAANPANHISIVPPDFYSYFKTHYRTEYSDNIHPNGIGYQSMGNLWIHAIVP